MRLYSNTGAMALGLPRTINNYLKPWIYINFKSEETMQAAMEITPVLNSSSLIWDTPDNVNRFCSQCSLPEHKAKDCDNSKSRGRKPTPKALLNVYKKHGIVNTATKRADKQQRSGPRNGSQFRSQSRNRPDNYTANTNKGKLVSYTNAVVGSSSINSSIHAPNNNSNNTGPNNRKLQNHPISQGNINQMSNIMHQAMQRLDRLVSKMSEWETAFNTLEDRLNVVEKHLNIVPIVTAATNQDSPLQNIFTRSATQQPSTPSKLSVTKVAPTITTQPKQTATASTSTSSSTSVINNNNTTPTMQGLSSEFDNMKGDVNSLRSMMANLGDMLQNLGAQQQHSSQ